MGEALTDRPNAKEAHGRLLARLAKEALALLRRLTRKGYV
jgi:hypothetical protein